MSSRQKLKQAEEQNDDSPSDPFTESKAEKKKPSATLGGKAPTSKASSGKSPSGIGRGTSTSPQSSGAGLSDALMEIFYTDASHTLSIAFPRLIETQQGAGGEPGVSEAEHKGERREELAKKTWDQFTNHIRNTPQKERGLLALNVIEENLRRRLATLIGEFESVKAHYDETVTVAGTVPNAKLAEPEQWELEILNLRFDVVKQDPDLFDLWKKAKERSGKRYAAKRKRTITLRDRAIRTTLKEQLNRIQHEIEFARFRLDVLRNVIWRHIGFGKATSWDDLNGREKAQLFGEGVAAKEDLLSRAQVVVDVYYRAPDKYRSWAELIKAIAETGPRYGADLANWKKGFWRHFQTNELEWPTTERGKANAAPIVEAIRAAFKVEPQD